MFFSEFMSCIMLGSLVSSKRLHSYLISSFLLMTEGFLSSFLSRLLSPETRPWPILYLFPMAPKPAFIRSSFSCLLTPPCESGLKGDIAPFTCGKILDWYIPLEVCYLEFLWYCCWFFACTFIAEWFRLIDSLTMLELMPALFGGPFEIF